MVILLGIGICVMIGIGVLVFNASAHHNEVEE